MSSRFCWLTLFSLAAAYCQSDLATVTGVVTDTAQAVMPAVTITIRNVDTNIARTIQTNEDGYFTVTNLPPGSYELVAERRGFRTYRETGIVLEVGQVLRSDVRLAVGSINDSVNVSAEIAPLNTENGAVKGDVIIQAEIQDIPLNGRDFTDLAFLVPGVAPNAQGGAGSGMAINGARGDNTNFVVDGFNNRDPRGAGAAVRPNLDAMQEFKMEVSGYSAEYGKTAGGVLNMVLRSGTNQYHGSLFEYLRNDVFDARAYFDPSKLPLHQNQFGATVLGPLRIPKVYNGHDRTFILLSWESFRQVFGQTKLGNVPTALERSGNFTKSLNPAGKHIQVKNPYAANAVFPGDVIPASLFSPIALSLMQYYPLPNRNNLQNNFLATANNVSNWDSFLGKIDHRFSTSDSMAFIYQVRLNRAIAPWAGSDLGTFGNGTSSHVSLGGLDYTHMFSPTLLTEAHFGFSRTWDNEHNLGAGLDTASQLGIQGSTKAPLFEGLPLITVLNFLPIGYAANEPVQFAVTNIQAGDKFTLVKGSHILKWGVDIQRMRFNQPFFNNSRGTIAISNPWTGDSIGDLLLGLPNNSSITAQITRNYLRATDIGSFFNDDWKITHALTLNLGMRYEIDKPPYDRYGRTASFIPGINKIIVASDKTLPTLNQMVAQANLTGLVGLANQYGLPQSLVYTNYKNFAPRIGLAWRPLNSRRTVIRSGYGIFYAGNLLNDIRLGLGTAFPFSSNQNFARVASDTSALTLANPFPQALAKLGGTNTATGIQLHAPTGYLQSYNLTIEREISRAGVLEVAYVGSKGTHLGRQYNLNMPYRSIANYEATGGFPLPVPGLSTINYWDFGSNSNYNAGQISFRKRAAGGFFYRLNYSFSKSIDDASQLTGASAGGFSQALDSRNLRLDRGRSDWDRTHILTIAFSWPLPVAKGNRFVGGWQLSGTSSVQSGPPITIEASTALINQALGESLRPNRIGSGTDVSGTGRRGVDYPWFNPGDFINVPNCASRKDCSPDPYGFLPFVPGNSGRNILNGPGSVYTNLSLIKNWSLRERKRIQFRYEVFNIFNHPNFLLPNRFFNETSGGIINGVQASGGGGPRIMQFALRHEF
jgi:hypothetical protein